MHFTCANMWPDMASASGKAFFSYARADSDFVLRVARDLRSAGADLWVDQLDIPAGERWDSAVESALNSCDSMVAVLSPASTTSNNVLDEISFALETHKKIIPIKHKSCDIPFRLRRLQYIDFTVQYDTALAKLLVALDVASPRASPNVAEAPGLPRERRANEERHLAGAPAIDVGRQADPVDRLETGTARFPPRARMAAAGVGALVSMVLFVLAVGVRYDWDYAFGNVFSPDGSLYLERFAIFAAVSGITGATVGAIIGWNGRRLAAAGALCFLLGLILVGWLPVVVAWPTAAAASLLGERGLEKLLRLSDRG